MRTELVTTLKRQATEILNQLEKDREPILITQHGVPSAYLVAVETFETLQRRMALLEGLARGEKAIEEGRTLTHTGKTPDGQMAEVIWAEPALRERSLRKAGNKDMTIVLLPGVSHDLMEAKTGYNPEWIRLKRFTPSY